MNNVIVETRNVSKTYSRGNVTVHALKGASLQIRRREMVSIMGPSGCGKTTLLNLLSGLDRPTSGQVIVDDLEITNMRDSELTSFRLAKMGFVFQFFNLIPTLTAVENVEFPLSILGWSTDESRRKALSLLEAVGLAEKASCMPNELSGGEQQRVAIARALANSPTLILADEPTGNLDSKTATELMNLLRGLNEEEGQTMIIVTHNHEVAKATDRTLDMKDGVMVAEEERLNRVYGYGDENLEVEMLEVQNRLDEIDQLYLTQKVDEARYRRLRSMHIERLVRIETLYTTSYKAFQTVPETPSNRELIHLHCDVKT